MARKTSVSKGFLALYLDSILESINDNKDAIIDFLYFFEAENAEITMKLDIFKAPSYEFKINKTAEKSPFGEEDEQ